jgi:hypothetical protein
MRCFGLSAQPFLKRSWPISKQKAITDAEKLKQLAIALIDALDLPSFLQNL